MAKITGGPSLPMTCVCCMATMLLTKSTPASAAATPFLTYTPDTNVDDVAYLDLDQRSILASLAASDEDGLVDAKNTYMLGRVGSTGAMTMKRLSTLAEEEFLGVSATYQDFVDYFGHTDYADRWISAAFGGLQTTLSDDANVNFSQLGVEGRGGMYDKLVMCVYVNVYSYIDFIVRLNLNMSNILSLLQLLQLQLAGAFHSCTFGCLWSLCLRRL